MNTHELNEPIMNRVEQTFSLVNINKLNDNELNDNELNDNEPNEPSSSLIQP